MMKLCCEHNRTKSIHPTDKKTYRPSFLKQSKIQSIFVIYAVKAWNQPTLSHSKQVRDEEASSV
jgi:hypothetical protein